jgi:hypothetical protein
MTKKLIESRSRFSVVEDAGLKRPCAHGEHRCARRAKGDRARRVSVDGHGPVLALGERAAERQMPVKQTEVLGDPDTLLKRAGVSYVWWDCFMSPKVVLFEKSKYKIRMEEKIPSQHGTLP